MNVKNWYIGFLVFTLFSCDNFVLKKENKKDIVKESLEKLNWHEVEQPPLFDLCKENSTKDLESCFQRTITEHIYTYLVENPLSIKETIKDTIWVPLLITKDGKIVLEDFTLPPTITVQIPDLKNIIEKSISSLPEIKPAHTRSTPVTTLYKLPLVIRVE